MEVDPYTIKAKCDACGAVTAVVVSGARSAIENGQLPFVVTTWFRCSGCGNAGSALVTIPQRDVRPRNGGGEN